VAVSDLDRFRVVDAEPCDDARDDQRRGGFAWGVIVGLVIGCRSIALACIAHLALR
jgi:hypothetical protein